MRQSNISRQSGLFFRLGWRDNAVDTITRSERSEIMSRVRSKNSRPEMLVRRLVHSEGYRYRLHARDLPGCPDLVFRTRRKVIFVHGCFWHRHPRCALARMPKSRLEFWEPKLEANRERDVRNRNRLAGLGWRTLTIWECQLDDPIRLRKMIRSFLDA
jgi:DNA mismatch endonuclease (patch repair protein)